MATKIYWEIHSKEDIAELSKRVLKKMKSLVSTLKCGMLVFQDGEGYSPSMQGALVVRLMWKHWTSKKKDGLSQLIERKPYTGIIYPPIIDDMIEHIDKNEALSLEFNEKGIVLNLVDNKVLALEIPDSYIRKPPVLRQGDHETIHMDDTFGDRFLRIGGDEFHYIIWNKEKSKVDIIPVGEYIQEEETKQYPRMIINSNILVGRKGNGDSKDVLDRRISIKKWHPREGQKESFYSFEFTTTMPAYEVDQKFLTILPLH